MVLGFDGSIVKLHTSRLYLNWTITIIMPDS